MSASVKTRSRNVIGAFGIGVSDLERSVDFYSRVLGMVEQRRIKIATMDEVVIDFEGRPPLVLMHYTDGSAQNYANNPVPAFSRLVSLTHRLDAL